MRVEAELESMTRKSHDASGQLVLISQELLKKERYLQGPAARRNRSLKTHDFCFF